MPIITLFSKSSLCPLGYLSKGYLKAKSPQLEPEIAVHRVLMALCNAHNAFSFLSLQVVVVVLIESFP